MSQGGSLKCWGRINTEQMQMFYEVVLTGQQYLIRYYNEMGKLRFIRPIKFPTRSVEIHSAGTYLLCYLHGQGSQFESEVFLVQLTNCQMKVRGCNLHLQCKQADSPAISTIYHSHSLQIVIFADTDNKVYALRLVDTEVQCFKIYQYDRKIKRIQLDRDEKVVLVTEQRRIKLLQVDWESGVVESDLLISHQADYYYENGFEVRFLDAETVGIPPQRLRNQVSSNRLNKEYILKITLNQAQYSYGFDSDSELIFFSTIDALFVLNKTNNTILRLVNSIFNVYGADESGKLLPSNLTQNNFLATYKVDNNHNVRIYVRVYDEVTRMFKTYTYTSLQKARNQPYLSFLKKNIDKIMHINGLIQPIHEETVSRALAEHQQLADNFDHSSEFKLDLEVNPVELARRLIHAALASFPDSLAKVVAKIKNHIANIQNTYCIIDAKRYYEYCHQIQNQIVEELPEIYRRMEEVSRSQVKSSTQSRQEHFLLESRTLIANMIGFLTLMNSQLAIEFEVIRRRKHEHTSQHTEAIDKNMAYYNEVLQSAKSIFVIIRLLLQQEIQVKFHKQFTKLAEKKQQSLKLWAKHHPELHRMEYPPLFLHQHFKTINDLTSSKTPSFSQFFSYLLHNRSKFIEVAYFYQYVSKIPAVPYLDSDVSDLIENIWIHSHVLPELQDRRQDEEIDNMRVPNLLYKMAATTLKLKQYSFIKYVIQIATTYKIYPLAVSLIHSGAFTLSQLDLSDEREHVFMVKSLLLAGKINEAYLYVIKNHSNELFGEFVRWGKVNENLVDLLQFKLDGKYMEEDDAQVLKLMNLPMEKQAFMQKLINNLQQQ